MLGTMTDITLFLDVDRTLLDQVEDDQLAGPPLLEHRLLALMRDMAVATHGVTAERAEGVIRRLFSRKVWWDWQDYLKKLELEPGVFWAMADEREARVSSAVDGNLREILDGLVADGVRVVMTSNNPKSGIRHKLRLAGLDDAWQGENIDRILGTDLVRAMKWHVRFWRRAIELADVNPDRVVVVGDTWLDDVELPGEAGIGSRVWLDRDPEAMGRVLPKGVCRVTDWAGVAAAVRGRVAALAE